jgi:hypothetical protein
LACAIFRSRNALVFLELTTAKEFTTIILTIKWLLEGMSSDGTGRGQGGVHHRVTFCWKVMSIMVYFLSCY